MTKKKITASERYWEKRRELEDKARLKLEKKTLSELESVFERALVKINDSYCHKRIYMTSHKVKC